MVDFVLFSTDGSIHSSTFVLQNMNKFGTPSHDQQHKFLDGA